jgi:hypothetical protein
MKAHPLLGLFMGATVICAPDARAIGVDDFVTFTFPGGTDALCARVAQFFTGVDGELWAWLVPVALPGALVRLPTRDVQRGCVARR